MPLLQHSLIYRSEFCNRLKRHMHTTSRKQTLLYHPLPLFAALLPLRFPPFRHHHWRCCIHKSFTTGSKLQLASQATPGKQGITSCIDSTHVDAALQPLERLYGVRESHVGGCQCLSAHQGANGSEQKLEVLHRVVPLDLLGHEGQNRATKCQQCTDIWYWQKWTLLVGVETN